MATERRAKLVLVLEDLASRGIKSVTDVYSLFKMTAEGVNQTLGRLKDFLGDCLNSFAESERAVTRLNNALLNQGFYTKEYSDALVAQAQALQAVTTYSDEAIIETQTLLTTFGLAGARLEQTTKSALDLSSGLGIDLRTATLMLGKAWAGETGTLSRYGIKIDETKGSAERFAQVMEQVGTKFGGRAAADANTYAGKIALLTNRFDDLKEKIGQQLLPVADFWLRHMTKATEAANKWMEGEDQATVHADKNTEALRRRIAALVKIRDEVREGDPLVRLMGDNAYIDQLQRDIDKLTVSLNKAKALNPAGAAGPAAAPTAPPPESVPAEDTALTQAYEKRMQSLTMTHAEIEQLEVNHIAKKLEAEGRFHEAKRLLEAQAAANAATTAKARMASTVTMLTMLSSLANAKNKEIAVVGKAAAISLTMINAHVAAGQALAAFAKIPPLAIAMASMMYAAGAAQAAQIAGVPLAEGGVAQARFGGIPAIIAEGGRDEAVIPLDDPRTAEKLEASGFGGGGGVHHHWHIGTLVADDGGLMDLARRMDEKLFALERRGARVSGT